MNSGDWLRIFQEALLDAFPTRDALKQMLRHRLDENLDVLASNANLKITVFELLEWADSNGKLDALLDGALQANPGNPRLLAFDSEPRPTTVPRGAVPPPFHVPFRQNSAFIGRDEDLVVVHELLQKSRIAGICPAALVGMGGIGKTQLAVEYAYRYRHAYPGGVFWVNAAEHLEVEFAHLAERVGLHEGGASESERLRLLAIAFAKYLEGRPDALVVFDNVEDPLSLLAPIHGFVPANFARHVLFTTRRRVRTAAFESVEMRVLSMNAAAELLMSAAGRRQVPASDRAEAEVICGMLGCLPLAVVLAGAYLGINAEIALGDYRLRLVRHGALATVDESGVDERDLATRHEAAVGATLQLQWDALKGEDARLVLKAAALLGESATVPRARLALLTGLGDRAEDGYPAKLGSALRGLHVLSLVEELTEQAIRLHPLVREFAERQIEAREAFAEARATQLGKALWVMDRLHEEVATRGVDAVLADLRTGRELANHTVVESIDDLLRPLDQEADCLRGWRSAEFPEFLMQQIMNRCVDCGWTALEASAEAMLKARGWPYLRKRWASGKAAHTVVRTLEGLGSGPVAVTPDGKYAISSSSGMIDPIKIWDIRTGRLRHKLHGYQAMAFASAVTSVGRAVTVSSDKTLSVWDVELGKNTCTWSYDGGHISCIAATPDLTVLVSGSDDHTIAIWDVKSDRPVHQLAGHAGAITALCMLPDGRLLSGSRDGIIKLWDIGTRQLLRSFVAQEGPVMSIAALFKTRRFVSVSQGKALKIWSLDREEPLKSLEGHREQVTSVAVTQDEQRAISVSEGGSVVVWDLERLEQMSPVHKLSWAGGTVCALPGGDEVILASGDRSVKVLDLYTMATAQSVVVHAHQSGQVAVTSDGARIVSISPDGDMRTSCLKTGKLITSVRCPATPVSVGILVADGQRLVATSPNGPVQVWSVETGERLWGPLGGLEGVRWLTASADGSAIVVVHEKCLTLWIPEHGSTESLSIDQEFVTLVSLSADGNRLLVPSMNGPIVVWDVNRCERLAIVGLPPSDVLHGFPGSVAVAVLTRDGQKCIVRYSDGTVAVIDLQSGATVRADEGRFVQSVPAIVASSDGRFAVSAGVNRMLRVLNLSSGKFELAIACHEEIAAVALSPDGSTIVAVDLIGALHVFDCMSPEAAQIVDCASVEV